VNAAFKCSRVFSARVFTCAFSVAYSIAVYINYPLFRYYPLVGRFSFRDLADNTLGPAMNWYGWIAMALVPAVLLAAIIPKRLGDRIPAIVFWGAPLIMFAAGWYRERAWFL
jgi:hypothetical protein